MWGVRWIVVKDTERKVLVGREYRRSVGGDDDGIGLGGGRDWTE